MNKTSLNVFFTVLTFFVFSCMGEDGVDGMDGQDGEDGALYIALSWVGDISFVFSDPNIPQTIFKEQYYLTEPGSYSYYYISWDDSQWTGTYSMTAEEGEPGESGEQGEPGSFMKDGEDGADGEDGEDGEDVCVILGLWSTGPEFYNLFCDNTSARIIDESQSYKSEYAKFEDSGILVNNTNQGVLTDFRLLNRLLDNHLENDDPDLLTKSGNFGKYSFKLTYKRIN